MRKIQSAKKKVTKKKTTSGLKLTESPSKSSMRQSSPTKGTRAYEQQSVRAMTAGVSPSKQRASVKKSSPRKSTLTKAVSSENTMVNTISATAGGKGKLYD